MNGNEPIGSDLPMAPDNGPERNEATMPLTTGEFGDDQGMVDPLAGADTGKRFKSGTILVALVVAVAIGGLVSMRTLAKVTAASTGSSDIEQSIEKWLEDMVSPTTPGNPDGSSEEDEKALKVLNAAYSTHQVPLGDVAKNPFVLPGGTEAVGTTENPVDAALAEREKKIEAARTAIHRAGGRLQVKSIMMGSSPLANVSGQIVQVDDVIVVEEQGEEIEFLVMELTTDVVTVRAQRLDLDLTIELELVLDRD